MQELELIKILDKYTYVAFKIVLEIIFVGALLQILDSHFGLKALLVKAWKWFTQTMESLFKHTRQL